MVKISSEKIREGIEHSLKKSSEHLQGAEALIAINSLNDAVALTEFAIEEFGRAVALREKLETGSNELDRDLRKNHDYKYDKAWTILPEELKIIYEQNWYWEGWWDNWWGAPRKDKISHEARLNAVFVNYVKGEWKTGIKVDNRKLEILIRRIREYIESFGR